MKKIEQHTLFKPTAPVAKTLLDNTTMVAREIVTRQNTDRNAKTARLRAARLAKFGTTSPEAA